MSRAFRLWENGHPVQLLEPAADAGGRTSGYVSLKNAHKAYLVCEVNQGNAATVLLTPLQATDVSGAGSKAIGVTPIVADLDTAASDVLADQAAAVNFTTDAGVKKKLVIFEIDPAECMDVANAFDCIAISTGASNAANITAVQLLLLPARYPGAQAGQPSALVN